MKTSVRSRFMPASVLTLFAAGLLSAGGNGLRAQQPAGAAPANPHAMHIQMDATPWAKEKLDKSPRHREWVSIKYGNRTVQAFIVYPEVSHKAPVVIVIHEIFGLSDWARELTDEIAAEGYIAIAPDLLSGMGPKGGGSSEFPDTDATVKAVSGLNPDTVTADLDATADYAKKLPAANGKLAVTGFCWGGGTTNYLAVMLGADLKAAAPYYGAAPTTSAVADIKAPLLINYAENDDRINDMWPAFEGALKAAGAKYEMYKYPGTQHGFHNNSTPRYQEAAAKLSWERMVGLFKKSLA